jgi:hypothetical protein
MRQTKVAYQAAEAKPQGTSGKIANEVDTYMKSEVIDRWIVGY